MIELRRPDASLHREWLDFVSDYDRPGVDGGSVRDDELAGLADPGVFAAWVAQLRTKRRAATSRPTESPARAGGSSARARSSG